MEEQQESGVIRYGDVDAKHYDWALSLGYMITDQWSVFAGYKSGKTNWDQSYSRDLRDFMVDGNIDGKFEQNGPFLGTSYSLHIGPGALTFKIAYAYLDGEYFEKNHGFGYTPEPNSYNIVLSIENYTFNRMFNHNFMIYKEKY